MVLLAPGPAFRAQVAAAAEHVAAGQYDARVNDPGLGREFAILAETSNTLAKRLEATETSRRRMLADLAHEMRTPLATVDAHLEAIEDGVRTLDDDTLGRDPALSTQRLRRLAEDISAVSRAEEGTLDIAGQPGAASDLARDAAQTSADRFDARASPSISTSRLTRRFSSTPIASAKCSPICSTTRCGTRWPAAP